MFVDKFPLSGFPDKWVPGINFFKWNELDIWMTVCSCSEMLSHRCSGIDMALLDYGVQVAHKSCLCCFWCFPKILLQTLGTEKNVQKIPGLAVHCWFHWNHFSRMIYHHLLNYLPWEQSSVTAKFAPIPLSPLKPYFHPPWHHVSLLYWEFCSD